MDENLLLPLRNARPPGEPDWADMERRLLDTFERRSEGRDTSRRSRTRWHLALTRAPLRSRAWRAVAAAAIFAVTAAITYYAPYSPGRSRHLAPPHASSGLQSSQPPAASVQASQHAGRQQQASRPETTTLQPPVPDARPLSRPNTQPARHAASGSASTAAGSSVGEFMMLPAAAGLPPFESGRIVRMEVPLTSLPAYGLDVVPDASPVTVEADFLIGQDGMPRAIRLASSRR